MTLKIEERHAPPSKDRLLEIEKSLNQILPQGYRNFLMEVGGGYTEQVTVPMSNGGLLLEILSAEGVLEENIEMGRDSGFIAHIPFSFLLVGDGSGGGLSLKVDDGDEGSVWWADYEKAAGYEVEEPHPDIMIRLADDFDAFLDLFGN